MNLVEQRRSAQTLSSNVRAGTSIPDALTDLAEMQAEYADHWEKAALAVANGQQLFQQLEGVWPDSLVRAVEAGEEAGQLEPVLKHIVNILGIKAQISSALKGLRFPSAVVCFGIVTFVLLMVFVIPKTTRSLHVEDGNVVTQLSFVMESFFKAYGIPFCIVLAIFLYKTISWLRTESGAAAALDFGLRIPHIAPSLRDLYFGLWCEYMALMVRAGIVLPRALELTAAVLPPTLRHGLELMKIDLVDFNLSLEATVNVRRLSKLENDPRLEWPRFVRQAFAIAERTATLDDELSTVGPLLIEDGVANLKAFCKSAEAFATIAGVVSAAICFVGVYSPIVSVIEQH